MVKLAQQQPDQNIFKKKEKTNVRSMSPSTFVSQDAEQNQE